MKIKINGNEYKQISKIMFSGTLESSSRRLEIEYLDYYKLDNNIEVDTGDKIELYTGVDELVFTGTVFSKANSTNDVTSRITAFDDAIRLSNNYMVKNYDKKTPSEITKQLLGELGLKVGDLPIDKVKCSFPAIDKTAYDIILSAYTIQHNKDKKIYSILADEESKIKVVEQGEMIDDLILEKFYNNTEYKKDIKNIINQIIVYDTKDNKINIKDKTQDLVSIKKYGVFQDVLRSDDSNNNIYDSKAMLKSEEEELNVRVKGDFRLRAGLSVALRDNISKNYGKFYIKSDVHMWLSNEYYTDLTFVFENEMNKIEIEEIEKKAKKRETDELGIKAYMDGYNKKHGGDTH